MKMKKTISAALSAAVAIGMFTIPETYASADSVGEESRTELTDDGMTHYLMVHFVDGAPDGNKLDEECIYFSVSDDGDTWYMLNNMEPIFRSAKGTLGLRDPHILRSHDGKRFYLIATDLSHNRTSNWGSEQRSGSKSIAVYDSADLVNWSEERLVQVAPDTAGCVWAPESVYDEEKGQYMVFWSSLTSDHSYDYHRVYRAYTSDFVTFTEPEVWIDNGYSTIDVSVKKIGDRYYRMSKNENADAKYVYFEVSKSDTETEHPLDGQWTPIEGDKIKEITQTGDWEGALFYKVNGTADTWRTMVDHYNGWTDEFPKSTLGLTQFETSDIANADFYSINGSLNFPSYTERTGAVNGSGKIPYKHGCVLPINDTEYNALVEKYGISAEGDHSTPEPSAPPADDPDRTIAATAAKIRVAPADGVWSTDKNSGGTAIVDSSSANTAVYELNSGNMMGMYYRFDVRVPEGKKISRVTLNMPNASIPNDNVTSCHRVRIAPVKYDAARNENSIDNIFADISDSGFIGKTAAEITDDAADISYVLAQPAGDGVSATDITDIYDTASKTNCFYIYNALGTNTGTKYYAPAYAYLTFTYVDAINISITEMRETDEGLYYKTERASDFEADIYAALYSGDGTLISANIADEGVLSGYVPGEDYTVKAFAWKPGTMEPLCCAAVRRLYAGLREETEAYLFVHFVGTEDSAADEQVYFSVSEDAINWETVNGGKPVLTSAMGEKGVRDMHIIRSPRGDKFYLIGTDLSMFYNHKKSDGSADWSHASSYGSQYINIWESDDLVNWSEQRRAHVATDDSGMAWAPESIYDYDRDAYMVFWASNTTVNGVKRQRIYCAYTTDFVSFTEPEIYQEADGDVIDTTIYYTDGKYYRFYKYKNTVWGEYADSLHADVWTPTGLSVPKNEGPEVFKFNGEDKWGLLVDADNYTLYTTDDLGASEFTKTGINTDTTYRHGSVIPITGKEYRALKEMQNIETCGIEISSERGADVDEGMFGLFFEDINYAADGGIMAEMIENYSFEFLTASSTEYDYGWSVTGSGAELAIGDEDGMCENNAHYAALTVSDAADGIKNKAYDGIYMSADGAYNISMYAKTDRNIIVSAEKDGVLCGSAVLSAADEQINGWRKYTGTLTVSENIDGGDFVIRLDAAGTADIDMVSCVSADAVLGRFRKDLVDKLAEMHPGFLRFPGGCAVEGGETLDTAYRWKDTVGEVYRRRLNRSRWQTGTAKYYNQSFNLGFYEYFELCEYLGAEPVPVVNAGLACMTYTNPEAVPVYKDSTKKIETATESDLTDEFMVYVRDVLDLIDFANSTDFENNEWAALRKSMGHEEPFNLNRIGIGNEQWERGSNQWRDRYYWIEHFVHQKDPSMKLMSSAAWYHTGNSIHDNEYKFVYEQLEKNPDFTYAVDEHYYETPDWFYGNMDYYDKYSRAANVFLGEVSARWEKKPGDCTICTLENAIAEAAYFTMLERNSDIIKMVSAAPLLCRVGGTTYSQWSPNLIWFDGKSSFETPSYYVQTMYGSNAGSYNCKSTVTGGSDCIYSNTVYDEETGELIIKVVNASDFARSAAIAVDENIRLGGGARVITLADNNRLVYNTIETPERIAPIETAEEIPGNEFTREFAANSFTVIRISADIT